jgi:hypothetical protein
LVDLGSIELPGRSTNGHNGENERFRAGLPARHKGSFVPRPRWFTMVDADDRLADRMKAFAKDFETSVPRVRACVIEW